MERISALFLVALITLGGFTGLTGCSGAKSSTAPKTLRTAENEGYEYEEEEEEEEFERKAQPEPMIWGNGIMLETVEGTRGPLNFHVGSPLFLRLRIADNSACAPFAGKPFYFDEAGSQLGWGFEEVADTLLFPKSPGTCERVLMLSSENSNRIAEGTYTLKLLLFMEGGAKLYSDTVVVQAVRPAEGASPTSYTRFLQEQILHNSPLLADPETIRALFAEGTPKSAESEVYRAAILYRTGDAPGADAALASARSMAASRGRALDPSAARTLGTLQQLLHRASAGR